MNDLELYREELANCDAKITEALKERYAIIEKIMAYKEEYGMPILQPEQEEKQKKRLMFSLHNDKHRDEIYDVFERIQRNSKKIQARKLFDYNIVLIGFMGAGKSTISDYLSTMFAMEVVEMDQLIAEREGMSISDIFETYGEEYFRNMETNLLIEMQEKKNVIISCGGGVAMRERNVAEMKKNGRVVLLTAHPQTILDRVKDSDDRPLLNGHKNVEYIEQLMEARREKYEAAADIVVDTDEGPRAGTTVETLSKLRCCSGKPDGVVTAGNASGINDGAAAVVVMSEEKAKELGVTPMATFVTGALGGVDPSIMGVGPVASTKKALAKVNMTIDDMDLIEANEAFAAQSVAVARDLKFDMSKVNVNGGAIALGHPVGASGCRILVTLLHEMQKRDAKKGLATLCIGGGMGCTTIVERD